MDPALREIMAEQAPAEEMEAIVKLAKPGVAPDGIRMVAQFGDIATCRLQVGDIQEVWSDDAVLSLKAPRELGSEPAADDLEATESVSSRTNPTPFTGKGVVVGIVDWGFDFTHPNFLNPDGSTRFLALWDQTAPADPSASKYGYGKVYGRQQIDEALKTQNPFDALGYHPASGDPDESGAHGTHVTDIAAGNGAVGEKGMAPGAELVGVHLSAGNTGGLATLGDSVRILEAIDFIGAVAGEHPLVINLSVGKHGGAHQGNSLVEQGLDNFLKEKHGRAIINSAGNYFSAQIHASGRLMPGGSATLDWEVDKKDRSPNELEVWYPHRDKLRLKIELPGTVTPAVEVDLGENQDVSVLGKIVGRAYHRENDSTTGDNHIDIFLYKNAPKGTWRLTLEGLDVVDGRWHAWIERDSGCRSCQSKFPLHAADPAFTTGSICNGMYTIAVGAYDHRDLKRKAALFSSAGPTADGRKKPNLLAPGTGIRAARSTGMGDARSNGELTIKSGTSMAAPHVTGAIALLFEAAGRLLPIETTRRLLFSSLESPPELSGGEEYRYGNGYLHVPALLEAAALSFSKPFAMKENLLPTLHEQSDDNESEPFDDLETEVALAEEENGLPWQAEEESEEEESFETPSYETENALMQEEEEEDGFLYENEEESGEEEDKMKALGFGTEAASREEDSFLYETEEEEGEMETWHRNADSLSADRSGEEEDYFQEEAHWGQHSDCRECGEHLVEQAEAWMQAESSEDFLTGFFTAQPSHAENFTLSRNGAGEARNLFDHLAFGKSSPSGKVWTNQFDVVAMPKSRLPESLLPGDLFIKRSIGEGKAWEAMALTGEFFSKQQAVAKGYSPDSSKPGIYLEVAKVRPVFRHQGEDFVKRVGDEWGRLLPDCLVLRFKPDDGFSGDAAPANWEEISPNDLADTPPASCNTFTTSSLPPAIGFEFDLSYGSSSQSIPPDHADTTLEAKSITTHAYSPDGFRLEGDGNRIEIATAPFELTDSGRLKMESVMRDVLDYVKQLKTECGKAHPNSSLGYPAKIGAPRYFVPPKKAPGVESVFPMSFYPKNSTYYTSDCKVGASPQATLTLPLAKIDALVTAIKSSEDTHGWSPGKALSGPSTARQGTRSQALYDAQRIVRISRDWHIGHKTPLSTGGVVSEANFTPALQGFLILIVSYLRTGLLKYNHVPDTKNQDYEGFTKAYLPLNVKNPFRLLYADLTPEEKQVFLDLYFNPAVSGGKRMIWRLAKNGVADERDKNNQLFPPIVKGWMELYFHTAPTWGEFLEKTVANAPFLREVDDPVAKKKGEDLGCEVLISTLSKPVPYEAGSSRVTVEMRRLGFDWVGSEKWMEMTKTLFDLARSLNKPTPAASGAASSTPVGQAEISTQQHPATGALEPARSGGEPCPAGSQKVTTQAADYTIVACKKQDGTLHGSYLETWKNGKNKAEGKYEQGRLAGKWHLWHENGQMETEMEFANGKEEGAYKKWFDNEKPSQQGAYRQGKKEGVWLFWDSDGQKREEGRFFSGMQVGTWQKWHGNGKPASKGDYDNDKPHGIWTTWHDNGQKEEEGKVVGTMIRESGGRVWEMPKRVERWTFWYPNGQKNKEGAYAEGDEQGAWNYWNDKGKLVRTTLFTRGVPAKLP